MIKKRTIITLSIVAAVFIFLVAIIASPLPKGVSYNNKIAVVPIYGEISSSASMIPGEATATPDTIIPLLEKAEKDGAVKAIVLKIDSGGGSPVASDEIAAKISGMDKPVVAWIGDVGASGAYWIATSADKIVAHPLSITCSIGAYSIISDLTSLFNKTGLNFTVIKSGEYKTVGSIFEAPTKEDERIFQNIVDSVHTAFVEKVAKDRNLSYAAVDQIADGRPCLGKDALDYGLVDATGNEGDAIALAEELAGISGAEVIVLKSEASFLDSLLSSKLQNAMYAVGSGIGDKLSEGSQSSVLVK